VVRHRVPRHRQQFIEVVRQLSPQTLTHAALLVACEEYPRLDPEEVLRRLAAMAQRAVSRPHDAAEASRTRSLIAAVNSVLFEDEGLRGDDKDYYEPDNSFLNKVLERKRGIPISLSVLYLEVARRAGLEAHGIGLPGHFIVGVQDGDDWLYVDPFHRGRHMSVADCQHLVRTLHAGTLAWEPEFLEPWSARRILARVLYNLKNVYLRGMQFDKALWVQHLLIELTPDEPRELRDRGLILAQLKRYGDARADLRQYLETSPERPDDAEEIEYDLERLRRLHLMLN
jgi:regulator of sirC expression with transglutaminase-like and TPR domain